jgi:putative addiction module component (TIGR02574 family)
MPKGLGQIFREASELPERDRAALAGLLIESLDPQDESEVEAAWEREIGRRITELDDGSVETVSWEDVRRQLFGRQDGG